MVKERNILLWSSNHIYMEEEFCKSYRKPCWKVYVL